MSDCIFCAIVDGDIPGRIVHETDQSLAFLDANPLAPGHTLVVPSTPSRASAPTSPTRNWPTSRRPSRAEGTLSLQPALHLPPNVSM